MRPLEKRLEEMYETYLANFGENYNHLPPVKNWHLEGRGAILQSSNYQYHEARFIRLVHAFLDKTSPGEILTSPYDYVRIFGKAKYDKKES